MKTLLLLFLLGTVLAAPHAGAQVPDNLCITLYKNGVTYQAWKYPNGKTRCARTIDANGVANGIEYRWREDGSMSFILTNINNRIAFVIALDEGGKCIAIQAFSHGHPDAPAASFYPSGLVKSYTPHHQKINEASMKALNQTDLNLTFYNQENPSAHPTSTASTDGTHPSPLPTLTSVSVNK